MSISSHFRNIFSNTPNTFGPLGKYMGWTLVQGSWASLWSLQIVKNDPGLVGWNSNFPPSVGFITNYLVSTMSTTFMFFVVLFFFFLQVQIEQMERLDLVIIFHKLSCKSFQEFYAPFLLNSFLEHVPILHICSFFLSPSNSGAKVPCLSF